MTDAFKGLSPIALTPQGQGLDNRIAQAESIALNRKAKDSPEKIEKAGRDFEALLIQQMLNEMWKTVPNGGLLSGSSEEATYRDMYSKGIADEIAAGQGIGIKDVITGELKKK